jgi:hypothetical protein
MKKVEFRKTLEYAVAYSFPSNSNIHFGMGGKIYRHVETIYDIASSDITRTIELCYDVINGKYVALTVSDPKIARKEIIIINN